MESPDMLSLFVFSRISTLIVATISCDALWHMTTEHGSPGML